MKIIEALKKIKDLRRKADDLKDKIKNHCADLDCETPIYPDQAKQISEWLQGHGDIIKEIGSLKTAVQRTNLATKVTIELDEVHVTKCISEWIDRRKELAALQEGVYRVLTDRNLKETYNTQLTNTSPVIAVKRRLYFDPRERDKKVELYRSEPGKIDSTLEIINAVTDIVLN